MSGGNLFLTIHAPDGEPGDYTAFTIFRRKFKTKTAFRGYDSSGEAQRVMYEMLAEELRIEGSKILTAIIEWATRKAQEMP